MPQGTATNAGEPATPPHLVGTPPSVRQAPVMLRRALRGRVRCDADALGQRTHVPMSGRVRDDAPPHESIHL
jgi:hypothetical protein